MDGIKACPCFNTVPGQHRKHMIRHARCRRPFTVKKGKIHGAGFKCISKTLVFRYGIKRDPFNMMRSLDDTFGRGLKK
jgi:hypothetical protein